MTRRDLLQRACFAFAALEPAKAAPETLAGTQPLDWQGDLSARMMDGAHKFVERKIAESLVTRQRYWKRNLSSPAAYETSVESNRMRFRTIAGVADARGPGVMAQFGEDGDSPLDAALVSAYFNTRQQVWSEPIYRNVFALLQEFGDAEIATLIAPRALVVEYSQAPEITNPRGDLKTPGFQSVRTEFDRIATLTARGFQPALLVSGRGGTPVGPGSPEAVEWVARPLGVGGKKPLL